MKIGILTFHRSYNYGAYAQCFSLVKRLEKEFPEHIIEVIDYTSKKAMDNYQNSILSQNKENRQKLKERNNAFLSCQEELPLSKKKFFTDEIGEAIEYFNKTYDAIIVGSDAVWNWITRGFPNIWFLKGYNGIKLSYAASVFGMVYQKITDEQKKYVAEALSEFSYIGTRDCATEGFVRFADESLTPIHNCDPTMFLDLNDVPCDKRILKKKLESKGVDFSKPLIGVMGREHIVRNIKRRYGNKVQLVAIYQPNKVADVYLNDLTPYEWMNVFSFFKLTITHYFHGTMLSIVNGTPVIPIELKNEYAEFNRTKIDDLMTRIGLSGWRFEANYRKVPKIVRILRRLGFCEDHKLWNNIYLKIDEMLENDYSKTIEKKRQIEAKCAEEFVKQLRKILNAGGKNR